MNRDVKIRAYSKTIPKLYRQTYVKACTTNSLRKAVNAKCLDCTNYQRIEIRECPVIDCPLWSHRPYQNGRESDKSPDLG